MNIKDVITSAVEASLATEAGDIEIADDMQKTSAWLVAMSTASIYFSFTQVQAFNKPVDRMVLYGEVVAISLLTVSFICAYLFRNSYTTFRALCRNLVVGRKILLSELHENADLLEKKLDEIELPLWTLIHSGDISNFIPTSTGKSMESTVDRQRLVRQKLGTWFKLQKRSISLGLIAMLLVSTYSTYVKVAT